MSSFYLFIIFGCTGSALLLRGFSSRDKQRLRPRHGEQASRCRAFSCCRPQALGTRAPELPHAGPSALAQELWLPGLVALRLVGSSQTGDRTCVTVFLQEDS